LFIGGLLFVVYGLQNEGFDDQSKRIVFTEADISRMVLLWEKQRQRPPTQAELNGLIERQIREQVMYREALAMGLDREDTLIRRRMRQKLEFVAEDLADAVEPTDQQLQEYLDQHPDSYRVDWRVSFRQVYLSGDRRGESLDSDAEQLLVELRTTDADPAELGDPSLLPHYNENLREREIPNLYGRGFGEKVLAVEPGKWNGPIESAYGLHLVFVDGKTAGRIPELDEVRGAVRRDWYAERRAASKDEFFQALREKYNVVIEEPDFTSGDDDSPTAK